VGAASSKCSDDWVRKMKKVGEEIGMAFQIKDDLFDYGDDEIGKPVGIDIKEKKLTLPLIYSLSKASWMEKRKIIRIVKNENEKPDRVKEVIKFVKESGGIDYAKESMNKYYQRSIELFQEFPDSEYKTSLMQLVQFTIERKN
jgi:octaprenyl-diphosphate synthase